MKIKIITFKACTYVCSKDQIIGNNVLDLFVCFSSFVCAWTLNPSLVPTDVSFIEWSKCNKPGLPRMTLTATVTYLYKAQCSYFISIFIWTHTFRLQKQLVSLCPWPCDPRMTLAGAWWLSNSICISFLLWHIECWFYLQFPYSSINQI